MSVPCAAGVRGPGAAGCAPGAAGCAPGAVQLVRAESVAAGNRRIEESVQAEIAAQQRPATPMLGAAGGGGSFGPGMMAGPGMVGGMMPGGMMGGPGMMAGGGFR